MKVSVHKPARVTITSHPITSSNNKEPAAQEELSYEEIEVDENSPVHYDKNVNLTLLHSFLSFYILF